MANGTDRELELILRATVVCEKPFTPTFKEAEELVAIANKQNKLLAVYQSTSSYLSQLSNCNANLRCAPNQTVAGTPTSSRSPSWSRTALSAASPSLKLTSTATVPRSPLLILTSGRTRSFPVVLPCMT